MLKKTLVIFFMLCFAALALADDFSAYDIAPGITLPKPSAPSDSMWQVQFNYAAETLSGDNGCVGVSWDGTYIWVSGRGVAPNPNMIYIISADGTQLVTSFPSSSSSAWGVRDHSTDGTYIYGGWESGLIKYDPSPLPANPATVVSTIPFPVGMQFGRSNAIDPNGNNGQGSVYCGNFSNPMYEMSMTGSLLRTFGAGPVAYGMAWDNIDPAGPWLWVHSQTGGCVMHQYNPTTMTPTGVQQDVTAAIVAGAIAGGCEHVFGWDPQYTTMIALGQGTPDKIAGFEMYPFSTPDLDVTITPLNPPINIPGGGGMFRFDAQIENLTSSAITFDAWTGVYLPNGTFYGPIILRTGLVVGASATITRTNLPQNVPGVAPTGNYDYVGYVGTHPGTVIDSSFFAFIKLPGDGGASQYHNWQLTGWFGDEPGVSAISEYALHGASPNPFNPTTTISFRLGDASNIQLAVFDINGREVSRLLEGWLGAGSHEVVFDGSGLSSGVYFCTLTADGFSATQKMALVK